ncbi:ThiF family adenylyltransferase [Moraxella sp. ZJ142]|uniref:HesA/MoeB/ThiF family protein n=1 Tax=Moraxella marmotae TaxID=3344520 RepID=UPI0035D3D8E1
MTQATGDAGFDNTTLSDDELMRYARQILLDDWDIDAQIRLKNSHAIIVGMGGLGCPVAQVLVRAGIGRLTIIDDDTVDDSNLQRQVLYTADDINQPKAIAAKVALRRQNHFCQIDAIVDKINTDNALRYLQHVDLVIDCTDNFAIRDLLNQICRKHHYPLLSTSAIAQTGQIALYTAQTACYQCVFGSDASDEQSCATSGVLASTVAVIGALASQVALTFLGKGINPIANQLLIWQGDGLQLRHARFSPDLACLVCGNH